MMAKGLGLGGGKTRTISEKKRVLRQGVGEQ